MWIDDVILLQQEYKRTINDKSIDDEVRHGLLVQPELYWSDGVKEFADKYGFSDELGSQDRYIIGTIAAERYSMATIRDLLTPKDPERAMLITQMDEPLRKHNFYRKKIMRAITGETEERIEPVTRGDVVDLVDVFLETCQELYASDKDVYKETYENLLKTFRANIDKAVELLEQSLVPKGPLPTDVKNVLLTDLPKTLIYNK